MRKFKVKNRQKRKYTRKNVPAPSLSLERGIGASLLPFLILAFALFTTMIISHNLREQDLVIEFSFQLPTISTKPLQQFLSDVPSLLQEPTAFAASLWTLVVDSVIGFGSYLSALSSSTISAMTNGLIQLAILLDPRPIFIAIGQGTQFIWTSTISGLAQLFQAIIFAINYIALSLAAFFMLIGQTIAWTAQLVFSGFVWICNTILDALIIVSNFLTTVTLTIAHAIVVAVQFTIAKVTAFIDALLYFLGTPFRMLAALWQIVKPYVDIFVQHLQMAGGDLNNGFKALNNFSSIIGPTK